jgi:hypothetical protein
MVILLVVGLPGCSPGPTTTPSSSTAPTGLDHSPTPPPPPPPAPSTPVNQGGQICASTPATQSCFFRAPSGSTSCELESDLKSVYCQTFEPEQSVQMDVNGALKICNKPQGCVGNPDGEASLGSGQTAARGPFTCRAAPSGVTCTVPSGKGFSISAAGITPVG